MISSGNKRQQLKVQLREMLEKKDSLVEFEVGVHDEHKMDLNEYCKYDSPRLWLVGAFRWHEAKSGTAHWNGLNKIWIDYMDRIGE